jgi:general secretion pathway protein G
MAKWHKIRQDSGFTLIEMVIVVALILILISIAVPAYNRSILHAKEAVLRQDLFTMRQVIDQYTIDKQKAPQQLDDLVQAGYMKSVPTDPFTGEKNWTTEQEDPSMVVDPQNEPGIKDVHSSSNLTSSDGTAYSTW